jgi:hypothetical protein
MPVCTGELSSVPLGLDDERGLPQEPAHVGKMREEAKPLVSMGQSLMP